MSLGMKRKGQGIACFSWKTDYKIFCIYFSWNSLIVVRVIDEKRNVVLQNNKTDKRSFRFEEKFVCGKKKKVTMKPKVGGLTSTLTSNYP